MEKLKEAKVAVFGLGGVGSFVCEGLARSGVGNFILIDFDKIDESNINRQLIANVNTIGRYKVDLMKERILEINPDANVETYKEFYMADSTSNIITEDLSYAVDCVDTIMAKIAVICKCDAIDVPVISSMGTGNKTEPNAFLVADLFETSVCPLARILRRECRRRGIERVKVVYSREKALRPVEESGEAPPEGRRTIPGSTAFVPAAAGLILAGEVVKDLIGFDRRGREEE